MNELRRIRAFLPRHIHRQYLGRGIPYRRYRGNTLRPLLEGERQVREGETAQSIKRDRGLLGDRTQARPSERDRLGVTGRGRHRAQHGEIHADTLCVLHLRQIMTRRRHPPLATQRSLPASSQTATREMDTIGTELKRDFGGGVQYYAHAGRRSERDRAPRKARIFGVARLFRTPLHQPDARIQHGFEARPKRHRVAWLGGNEIHGRQTRRRDDGLVGGGEGVSGQIIGRHPYHRLPLTAMRLASKGVHTPHVQQDRPIGIIVTYADQRSCLLHLDADLFIELACERRGRGLARLDLAAWKLPTPSLMPMGGAASNEHAPCGVDDHRHRYVHDLCNGQHAGFFAIHDGTVERITTCLLIPYRSPAVNKVMLWLMREFLRAKRRGPCFVSVYWWSRWCCSCRRRNRCSPCTATKNK